MNLLISVIIAILSAFLKRRAKPIPQPVMKWWETNKPTSTAKITGTELWSLLHKKFPEAELYISDASYLLASYDDIALFLAQDATNKFDYKKCYDCDNFSFRLMGQFSVPEWSALTLGIVWTDKHALNVVVTEKKQVYFIEPQDDTLNEELKNWQGNKIRFIMI